MRVPLKDRLLPFWDKLVRFAQWCEAHGIPKMLIDLIFKLVYWWLTSRS